MLKAQCVAAGVLISNLVLCPRLSCFTLYLLRKYIHRCNPLRMTRIYPKPRNHRAYF